MQLFKAQELQAVLQIRNETGSGLLKFFFTLFYIRSIGRIYLPIYTLYTFLWRGLGTGFSFLRRKSSK